MQKYHKYTPIFLPINFIISTFASKMANMYRVKNSSQNILPN